MRYQAWLHQTAYAYLESLDVDERQRLFVWIERLCGKPDLDGDFTEVGGSGRVYQGMVIGAHAVIWWVDTPVREVKVLSIRRADQQ